MPNNRSAELLGEFAEPTLAAWRQEVERLLRGAPFDRRMFSQTAEGPTIRPMYTEADTADLPWLDSRPGQAPFIRGSRPGGNHEAPWLVAQEHRCATADVFNSNLRQALERGQTAVWLVFDVAGRLGRDPDQVEGWHVGYLGTSISSLAEMAAALAGVDLARYPIFLQAGGSALPAAANLAAFVRREGGQVSDLRGCLGCSPITGLARRGQIRAPVAQIHKELALLTTWAAAEAPQLRTLPVSESPWHEGGADLALSLALTLSEAVGVLRAMESHGLPLETAAPRFQFNLEVGTDFFMEMAKIRALRLVWSRLLTTAGLAPELTNTFIHARTARRMQSTLDREVNLLRGTTAAMSAVLGGADSLHVAPYDEVNDMPDDFSRRIARNVQLILAHECHFDQVTDPAGGSWYVESLTRELAATVWEKFQAVEEAGGVPQVLVSGWAQDQVAAAAARRAARFATRREVMVGTNMYPNPVESPCQTKPLDCDKLHRERSAEIAKQRVSANETEHVQVLTRLERIMDCPDDQVFEAIVAAAEVGATLGELAEAMRGAVDPSVTVDRIPLRRDAEPFEALRARVVAVAAQTPAAARVFLACLGDFARYMPRLEFARGFCQVGGFTVTGDNFHDDPADAVQAARDDGAHTVVLVGLDETYAAHAESFARALSAGPAAPKIVLAGAPGDHEDKWRSAGVHSFINLRSNVLTALAGLLPSEEAQS